MKRVAVMVLVFFLALAVTPVGLFETGFSQSGQDSGGPLFAPSPSHSPSYITYDQMPLEKETMGTVDVLVILLDFSDVPHNKSQAEMNQTIFGDLRDYLRENSYGKFDIEGNTTTWVTANQTLDYYGEDGASIDDANGEPYTMVQHAIQLVDPFIDFTDYDRDGNGRLDQLFVLHAGRGQEVSGQSTDIWSHYNNELYMEADGIQCDDYATASEYSSIGVVAHEFGHLLGLLDYYDTDGSDIEGGTGQWALMSMGVHNDGGSHPSQLCAFSRMELGWLEPTTIMLDQEDIAIRPVEDTDNGSAYRIPIGSLDSEEYFLVTMRMEALNETLYGEGILIWHIDEGVLGNDNDFHRMVEVEQADNDNNPGNSGDTWSPGTMFSDNSYPNSKSYSGDSTNVTVYDFSVISNRSASFSAVVSKSFRPPVISPIPDYVSPLNYRSGSINLANYGSDPDGDPINWSVVDFDDARLDLSINNSVLFIEILSSTSFITNVTLRLTDIDGLYATTNLTLSILPYDQPPNVVLSVPMEAKVGEEIVINTSSSNDIDDEIVVKEYLASQDPVFLVKDVGGATRNVTVSAETIEIGYLYYYHENPLYLYGKAVETNSSFEFLDASFSTEKPSGVEAYTLSMVEDNIDYFKTVNTTWTYVSIEDVTKVVTNDTQLTRTYSTPGNVSIMVIMRDTFGVANYELETVLIHPTDYYVPSLALISGVAYEEARVGEMFQLALALEFNSNTETLLITREVPVPPLLVELYTSDGQLVGLPRNFDTELEISIPHSGDYTLLFTLSVDDVGNYSDLIYLTPVNVDGDEGETSQVALNYVVSEQEQDTLLEVLGNPAIQALIIVILAVSTVALLFWMKRRGPKPVRTSGVVRFNEGPPRI